LCEWRRTVPMGPARNTPGTVQKRRDLQARSSSGADTAVRLAPLTRYAISPSIRSRPTNPPVRSDNPFHTLTNWKSEEGGGVIHSCIVAINFSSLQRHARSLIWTRAILSSQNARTVGVSRSAHGCLHLPVFERMIFR
jgi:hypothetical protein